MGSLRPYQDHWPQLGDGVYIDPAAVVIGQVRIGAHSSVWPTTVIRGDVNQINIGSETNIQDGSVLHVTHVREVGGGFALNIGDRVTIGHKVILHGCAIGDECLIGMGAVVMDGARLHRHVLLGAGSLVPPGKDLEGGYLWLGNPVRRVRPLREEELSQFAYSAAHYRRLKDQYLNQV